MLCSIDDKILFLSISEISSLLISCLENANEL